MHMMAVPVTFSMSLVFTISASCGMMAKAYSHIENDQKTPIKVGL